MHSVRDDHTDQRSRSTTTSNAHGARRKRSYSHSHSPSPARSRYAWLPAWLKTRGGPVRLAMWVSGSITLLLLLVLSATHLSDSQEPLPATSPVGPLAANPMDPYVEATPPPPPPLPSARTDFDTHGLDASYNDTSDVSDDDTAKELEATTPASQALARAYHRLPSRLSKLGLELGNLALIRGTAAPRVPVLPRQLGLLAVPVGAKSRALMSPVLRKFKAAGFAIYLFHYDTSGPWPEFASDSPSVTAPGQAKFWFAKRFLTPEVVENYEYIFLWDDDVGFLDLDAWDPLQFVQLMRSYAIHIAQPAIVDGLKDYDQAKVVKWNPRARAPGRWTSFVEMMFGVYSREAWQNCIWDLLPWNGRSYWGTDFAFYPHCAAAGYCRMAVLDALPVRHLDKHLFKSVSMANMREMRLYVQAYTRIMCEQDKYGADEADAQRRGQLECAYLKQMPLGSHVESFRDLDDMDTVDKETCPASGKVWWPGVKNWVQVDQSGPEWAFVKVEDKPAPTPPS